MAAIIYILLCDHLCSHMTKSEPVNNPDRP